MSSQTSSRPLAVWLTTAALVTAGASVAVHASAAPPSAGAPGAARAGALAAPIPVVTSDNVSLETVVPAPTAISIAFSRSADFAYVSGLTSLTVLDTSDPAAPVITGVLPVAQFQNESMTYGERVVDGELKRFVLLAVDLFAASPTAPGSINIGGQEVQVVDVTDPTDPVLAGQSSGVTTSTHTAQCVSETDCEYVYTAGTGGEFSILDMRDMANPVEVKTVTSPASGPDRLGLFGGGAGHYWDFDGELGWHTGSGGAAAFDVSDPLNPVLVNATTEEGRAEGLNDFILHNSMRPNADRFVPGAEPSVENGNVLLVAEEDYLNDGDEVACERAGSFQTWHVPDLDGAAYRAKNPTGDVQDVGTVTNLDAVQAPADFGGGLTTPVAAFCSMHWFDYHQDGFVATAWYGGGMRILDVRDARSIDQVGYATTAVSEVWDAYWVPVRDADGVVVPGQKTDVVYSVDATRGVDVYRVALPTAAEEPAPTEPPAPQPDGDDDGSGDGSGDGTPPQASQGPLPATGAGAVLPVLSVLLLGAAAVARRRART